MKIFYIAVLLGFSASVFAQQRKVVSCDSVCTQKKDTVVLSDSLKKKETADTYKRARLFGRVGGYVEPGRYYENGRIVVRQVDVNRKERNTRHY